MANDTIINDGSDNTTIVDRTGFNSIEISGYNVSINGSTGNDSISLGDFASKILIQYKSGDGNDSITGFKDDDTLKIGDGTGRYSSQKSDNDIIVTVGTGKITLQGAANLSTVNIAGTTSSTMTITDSTPSPVTAKGSIKTIDASKRTIAIRLTGNALDNTLSGGLGNDSLWSGAGNDTLVYADGNGKDFIFGFENQDLLKITGAFSASYDKSKEEIYFKVATTKNAITPKDFTATSFNVNGTAYKISGSSLTK